MNGLFSGSAPFLERNLVTIVLDSSLGFFCQIKTNTEQIDPVRCEQLDYVSARFGAIFLSIVHIVSDRFPNRTENRSGVV